MIEENIVDWVDINYSLQYLDVYGKKRWIKFFNLIRVLISYKTFSVFFYIFFKFFFFLQILMLTLTNIEDKQDSAVMILKYISTVIFIQDIVKDEPTYQIAVMVNSILTIVTLLCLGYLAISIKIGKFYMNLPIYFLNLLNVLIMNYLIGPIVQISILSTNCKDDGMHIYLKSKCFSGTLHIVFFVVSILNLLFYLIFSVVLSIYYNELGSVNENKLSGRINCNYEIYMNISKISMFVIAYWMQSYLGQSAKIYQLILQILILLNSLFFTFYSYYTVLFYDNKMNIVTINGWSYVAWFAFVILLKSLLNIYDTSIFHVSGWIILTFIIYFVEIYKEEYLLTDFNIFEAKTLKDIELFNMKLYNLMNIRSIKNKTMLLGIIDKFEKYFKTVPEMNNKYITLCSNKLLKKKFNSSLDLPLLSIVYLIYDYHLEKSALKNDILLTMSYFLMNKFKKAYLGIFYCSKMKITNHKLSFFKFILMEEIKEYLVNKLTKSNNKESIKHVQIGSVILYNIYTEMFRVKIVEAAHNQIEYFDTLRNNNTTAKTTKHFLSLGKEILSLRKEILKLWGKLLELNPFSDECEGDFILYLETIMQDDTLAKTELKKFNTLKNNKLSERTNVYHSMFIKDISAVALVDGHSVIGKILYVSSNFAGLFGFSGKELLSLNIEDLMPDVISGFHKELMNHAIKFSNFSKIFCKQLDILFKGKTGGIYNVKIFIKCIPNFSFGLVYMIYISKIKDNQFIIVLDKDLKINGLTDNLKASSSQAAISSSNYGLNQNVFGHSIAMIIPEILMQIEYQNEELFIPKSDIELKGALYPVVNWKEADEKINNVFEIIKKNGRLANEEEMKKETIKEFEELINNIAIKSSKSFSIFFRITTKTFLDGKYKYHRVYITNDLIALNEHSHYYNSTRITNSESSHVNDGKKSKEESKSHSKKKIKLRGLEFDAENKELLHRKKKDDQNDPKNQNNQKNDKKNENKIFTTGEGTSSVLTKSSIDSASFNKLKNGILEKKEVTAIKAMKYLGCFYGLLTILLIYLSYLGGKTNFDEAEEYLKENLFFNHTKIDVSCVYLSVTNLKWVKYKFIPTDNCYFQECSSFFPQLLSDCIIDMKKEKENSSFFYADFKDILLQTLEIDIEIFQKDNKKALSTDIDNLLTFIISNGLNLKTNTQAYQDDKETIYEIVSNNLISQSLVLLGHDNISGFDKSTKEKNIGKLSSNLIIVPLIVDVLLFVCLILSYSILIYKLNKMESSYLEKLIMFKSPSFEMYIKTLEDLKKKLRNDNGEDDDKINDSNLSPDNSKLEEDEKEDDSKPKGKANRNKDKDKDKPKEKDKKNKKKKDDERDIEKEKQTLSKKKKNEKNAKIQQMKEAKIKTMTGYFIKWNIFFTIRVMTVFVIALSYFLVISIMENINKTDLLDYDSNIDSIEGTYKASYDLFLEMKKILTEYVDYEIEKGIAINCKQNAACYFFKLNGTKVTKDDYTLEQLKDLPPLKISPIIKTESTTPKLGTLLMQLINDKNLDKDQITLLNTLYNGNACNVLFNNSTDEIKYSACTSFWSSILLKGMEQSITQMGVVLNNVKDEINALNGNPNHLVEILNKNSSFSQYEFFVEYYLLQAYFKSVEIFMSIKSYKLNKIDQMYLIILLVYIGTVLILIFMVLQLIRSSRKKFNLFLNFIGILPIKYIAEDEKLYKDLLMLEKKIYY